MTLAPLPGPGAPRGQSEVPAGEWPPRSDPRPDPRSGPQPRVITFVPRFDEPDGWIATDDEPAEWDSDEDGEEPSAGSVLGVP